MLVCQQRPTQFCHIAVATRPGNGLCDNEVIERLFQADALHTFPHHVN